MDTVTHALTALWALRWLFALAAFALLGWLYAEALTDLRTRNDELAQSRETIRRLRLLVGAQRRRNRSQVPILTGRVIR